MRRNSTPAFPGTKQVMSPLNYPAMAGKMVLAELEMVRAFRATSAREFAEERLALTKASGNAAPADAEYDDFLSDRYVLAEELFELAEELAIVGAYRVFELNAKRVARWLDKSYTNFNWPSFRDLLKTKARTKLSSLPSAASIDELRLLNNAIKHEGTVSAELARYPGWVKGARVHPLAPAFDRMTPAIPVFVEALARVCVPQKLGGTRPDPDVS